MAFLSMNPSVRKPSEECLLQCMDYCRLLLTAVNEPIIMVQCTSRPGRKVKACLSSHERYDSLTVDEAHIEALLNLAQRTRFVAHRVFHLSHNLSMWLFLPFMVPNP